ncbi:MAG: hypothetical protein AB1563_02025 [Bacillota bacterium]
MLERDLYGRLLRRVCSDSVDEEAAEQDLRLRRTLLAAARDRQEALAAAGRASTLGSLLRDRRLGHGLGVVDLASTAGIDADLIQRLEADAAPPWRMGVEEFVRVLVRLGLPVRVVYHLVDRVAVTPPSEPLPAQARTVVTGRAERLLLVQEASARLQVRVEEARKRRFLEGLRQYL